MVYEFFDKKSVSLTDKFAKCGGVNNKIKQNEQLAQELHKPIIKRFQKRRVCSSFKDNIWGADLADIHLISKFNKEIRLLLCVIDFFSKHAWVVSLKDKKSITIANVFQKILDNSKRTPNKVWVDKGI